MTTSSARCSATSAAIPTTSSSSDSSTGTGPTSPAKEAAEQIRAAALGLIAEGVQPGDRVALLSATRYEWPIIDFAILAIGALTVPIYETSSVEQIRFVLENSEAVLIFAETDEHADRVEQIAGALPKLRKVFRIAGSGTPALEALAEAGRSVDPSELDKRLAAIRSSDPAP
jgi:Long-chain acyl-CoA synthetases (AMP-forming)